MKAGKRSRTRKNRKARADSLVETLRESLRNAPKWLTADCDTCNDTGVICGLCGAAEDECNCDWTEEQLNSMTDCPDCVAKRPKWTVVQSRSKRRTHA